MSHIAHDPLMGQALLDRGLSGERPGGEQGIGRRHRSDLRACRQFAALPDSASSAQVVADPAVRAFFQAALDAGARGAGSSSSRLALESEIPTLDSGELSAKSAISQATVLTRRAAEVDELYRQPPAARVLVAASRGKA